MKDYNMNQCKLRKGNISRTAWIPSKFAKKGRCIKLKDVDGWVVESVGFMKPSSYVLEHERNYLTQRQASDI